MLTCCNYIQQNSQNLVTGIKLFSKFAAGLRREQRTFKSYKEKMMKKLIALCSFVFLLCSCAGVNVKQPDIGNVKKVAILSVILLR